MTEVVVIAEGKTKRLIQMENEPGHALVVSKDNVTSKDGKVNKIMLGKGDLANATTCHVLEALQLAGVPSAFVRREGDTFVTKIVDMIPVEIVVRNQAAGSYCERYPDVQAGTVFTKPLVECYYKTSGERFRGKDLGCDDPLMIFTDDGSRLAFYHPHHPIDHERPLLEMDYSIMTVHERRRLHAQLQVAERLALKINKVLATMWAELDGELVDFKIECGILPNGDIVPADVIDCDSWRVLWKGQQLSKQPFRDGMDVEDLRPIYMQAELLVRQFPEILKVAGLSICSRKPS